MKTRLSLLFLVLLITFTGAAAAQTCDDGSPADNGTPDGCTPAQENVCDIFANEPGPEFGLCNAYCEAMDCDDPTVAAEMRTSCDRVLDNFIKKSGGPPPCGARIQMKTLAAPAAHALQR